MTVVLISGGLTFVVGLLIVRPFSVTGGRLRVRAHAPDDDRRRELLRQLRDLDDDLAAGKLTQADHLWLRDPVEREAVAALKRKTHGPVAATAVAIYGLPQGRDAGRGGKAQAPPGRHAVGASRSCGNRHVPARRRSFFPPPRADDHGKLGGGDDPGGK